VHGDAAGHEGVDARGDRGADLEGRRGGQQARDIADEPDGEEALAQPGRAADREALRALGDIGPDDLDRPAPGLRVRDLDLLDVVEMVLAGLDRGRARAPQRDGPGEVPPARRVDDDEIEVVDEGPADIGRARRIVPRERDLELALARGDIERVGLDAAVEDAVLVPVAGARELDRVDRADGAVAGLVVGPGVEQIDRGVGEP
jgi:hypothetical protein